MEYLKINNGNGQSYGITVYRKMITAKDTVATLKIIGHVRDIAMVVLNGEQITKAPKNYDDLNHFGFWPARQVN
jgi:hypothetical protein